MAEYIKREDLQVALQKKKPTLQMVDTRKVGMTA